MVNRNQIGRSRILELLKGLLEILEKEGKGEVNFAVKELRYVTDLLTNCIGDEGNCDEKTLEEVKSIYKSLYPPHGGLTDFFIWREDFDERKKLNDFLDKISDELWKLLS
jgi:hypothetical protein